MVWCVGGTAHSGQQSGNTWVTRNLQGRAWLRGTKVTPTHDKRRPQARCGAAFHSATASGGWARAWYKPQPPLPPSSTSPSPRRRGGGGHVEPHKAHHHAPGPRAGCMGDPVLGEPMLPSPSPRAMRRNISRPSSRRAPPRMWDPGVGRMVAYLGPEMDVHCLPHSTLLTPQHNGDSTTNCSPYTAHRTAHRSRPNTLLTPHNTLLTPVWAWASSSPEGSLTSRC
jgi:hypothetical protein